MGAHQALPFSDLESDVFLSEMLSIGAFIFNPRGGVSNLRWSGWMVCGSSARIILPEPNMLFADSTSLCFEGFQNTYPTAFSALSLLYDAKAVNSSGG